MSRIRVREKSTSSSGRGRLPPTRPPSLPLTVPPNSSPQVHAVNDMLQAFKMSSRQCYEIAHLLDKEIESGLDKEGHKKATVKCFPSYVQVMPTEVELSGYYLSVDVGGTNARIMGGRLKGADSRDVNHLKAVIPDTLKTGSGEQLFNWVAEMLWRYIDVNHCSPKVYHMGFTFSFPLNQMGLTKAVLIAWTKGFTCSGVLQKDVVPLMQAAIDRKRPNRFSEHVVKVSAVVNDTTATLMACMRKYPCCRIGVICGTGTNACYLEDVAHVKTFIHDEITASRPPRVIVNTEWGAFGDNGVLDPWRTRYDRVLDRSSRNPGKQIFEKMVSGMYLGEIVRLIMLDAVEKKILFQKEPKAAKQLRTPDIFDAKFLSACAEDVPESPYGTKRALQDHFGMQSTSFDDEECRAINLICDQVCTRAGCLVAAALNVLVRRVEDCGEKLDKLSIGTDGSLLQKHPTFKSHVRSWLLWLMKDMRHIRITMDFVEDASGIGAAVTAACHAL